jgi:hypothetical protein
MLPGAPAVTSGRRFAAWGSAYATYVHVVISVRWYAGMGSARGGSSYEDLHALYTRLYTDAFR